MILPAGERGSGAMAVASQTIQRWHLLQVWAAAKHNQSARHSLPQRIEELLSMNQKYAQEHGYTYDLRSSFHPSLVSGFHPAWLRIAYIADLLKSGVQLIAYLDTDVQVINHSMALQQVWDGACRGQADLLVLTDARLQIGGKHPTQKHNCCQGKCACFINTGFMLVRNTAWSREFFNGVLGDDKCNTFHLKRQWDQDCMQLRLRATNNFPKLNSSARGKWGMFPASSSSGHVCAMPRDSIAPWEVWRVKADLKEHRALPLAVHLRDENVRDHPGSGRFTIMEHFQPNKTFEAKAAELSLLKQLISSHVPTRTNPYWK